MNIEINLNCKTNKIDVDIENKDDKIINYNVNDYNYRHYH